MTNTVTVSGGGEINTSNDTATDLTTITTVLPLITGTTPSLTGGTLTAGATTLAIAFNEAMNGAGTASNYQLESVGPSGLLGTADDAIIPLSALLQRHHRDLDLRAADGKRISPDRKRDDYQQRRRPTGRRRQRHARQQLGYGFRGGSQHFLACINDELRRRIGSAERGSGQLCHWRQARPGRGQLGRERRHQFGANPLEQRQRHIHRRHTLTSGISTPYAVAVGDFNGNGKADVAVANYGNKNVEIFYGNGDGTFSTTTTVLATGTEPINLAVGDFNGDGKADLAVANYGSNTLEVFLSNRQQHVRHGRYLQHRQRFRASRRGGGRLQRRRQARSGRGRLRQQ